MTTQTPHLAVVQDVNRITRSQEAIEEEMRSVIARQEDANWEIGDLSLEALPRVPDGTRRGVLSDTYHSELDAQAERVGIEVGLLKTVRSVAHAWPQQRRIQPYMDKSRGKLIKTPWSCHRILMTADAQDLLTPGMTASQAREALKRQTQARVAANSPRPVESRPEPFESDVKEEQADWDSDPQPEKAPKDDDFLPEGFGPISMKMSLAEQGACKEIDKITLLILQHRINQNYKKDLMERSKETLLAIRDYVDTQLEVYL